MALYNTLSESQWEEKEAFFRENYQPCCLCPRLCGVDREKGGKGVCKATNKVKIGSYNLHFGEEPPISGARGSGTVFFSGCTMKCVFCQNYPISHLHNGQTYSTPELADIFLNLQERGAHNINFVTATPYLFHIIIALHQASKKGLNIPIVYNSSGYERSEIIKGLAKIVDIYLPDLKYHTNELAMKYSGANNYFENAVNSLREMFSQVGELIVDDQGIGIKGLILRHLLLPGHVENSKKVLDILAENEFRKSHLSLMSQYFPAHKAVKNPEINRRVNKEEYLEVKNHALQLGFSKGWFQDID
jgi:putative pyruvate formate lyase activating enzyme